MIGYSERHYLPPCAVEAFRRACTLVERVVEHTATDGQEIRCHELARAVTRELRDGGFVAEVVDGQLGSIDHTWILLPGQGGEDAAILDVYTPGRIPQVQLIHDHPFVSREYVRGLHRVDVREKVVGDLHRQMSRSEPIDNLDPAWVRGFATALVEVHGLLLNGNDEIGIQRIARDAGVDLVTLRKASVRARDIHILRKVGVP